MKELKLHMLAQERSGGMCAKAEGDHEWLPVVVMAKRPPVSKAWNRGDYLPARSKKSATQVCLSRCWVTAKFWILIIICHVFRLRGRQDCLVCPVNASMCFS